MQQGIDTSARVAGRDYYERCTLHLHTRGGIWWACLVTYAVVTTLLSTRPGMSGQVISAVIALDVALVSLALGYLLGCYRPWGSR